MLYRNQTPRRVSLPTYPFAKERYWLPHNGQEFTSSLDKPSFLVLHPLVHQNISDLTEQRFSTTFTGAEFLLTDHQVQDEKVLPGVAYLEMARVAGAFAAKDKTVTHLRNVVWARPIIVSDEPLETHVSLYPEQPDEVTFEVTTLAENEQRLVHAQGRLVYSLDAFENAPQVIDLEAIRQRCTRQQTKTACYRQFQQLGLVYGPGFQVIEELVGNQTEALVKLQLPAHLQREMHAYGLHPSLMDGALQALMGVDRSRASDGAALYLPFTVRDIAIHKAIPASAYAYISFSEGVNSATTVVNYDLVITDEQGEVCVYFKGCTARALSEPSIQDPEKETTQLLYSTPVWQTKALLEQDDETEIDQTTTSFVIIVGLEQALVETISNTFETAQVVMLEPEPGLGLAEHVSFYIDGVWKNLKTIVDQNPTGRPRLFVVVSETIHEDSDGSLLASPLMGLVRTVRLEHPKVQGKVITLASVEPDSIVSILTREMASPSFDDIEVRYDQAGQRHVKQLIELSLAPTGTPGEWIRAGGVYWITGGLGSLGRILTRYLIDHQPQAKIIVSGRSALAETDKQYLAEFDGVEYLPADVSRSEDVRYVVETIKARYGQINGIIHSAGVIRDSLIINKTGAEIRAVLAPKVVGVLNIDAATQDDSLDFMILFSSTAGVMGNIGQADYAAANAFLDAFAHYRQKQVEQGKRHGQILTINWPLWQDGGMQRDRNAEVWIAQRTGMVPLSTRAGLQTLEWLLVQKEVMQLIVAQGDGEKIRRSLELVPGDSHRPRLAPISNREPQKLQAQVESELLEIGESLLKVKRSNLDVETELSEYGVDSILMMGLLNKLEARYGLAVAPNAILEYPTIRLLAGYLIEAGIVKPDVVNSLPNNGSRRIWSETEKRQSQPSPAVGQGGITARERFRFRHYRKNIGSGKVAIIGQTCRLPQSSTLEHFWRNLANGHDLVTTVPANRWQTDVWYHPQSGRPHKTYTNHGAFIDGIDLFDAGFFGISDEEAITMDPQQRIMLELAQELWDRAGYRPEEVAGTNTGVFIGAKDNTYVRDYFHLIPKPAVQHTIVNSISNMIPARISDFYNLTGTSQVIDTACSSSLVAVHDACRTILNGEAELAIAGGIFLMVDAFGHVGFSQAKVLSDEGRSYVFDERAKGFVLGEGGGLVLLKAYEAAVQDGDQILGVILGSAVNNDGHTMGLTVPNQTGQKAVIEAALRQSGVSPADISYLEAHGTGTLLGDPIEIRAATEVYRHYTAEKQYCAVGAVKSNVGHTMTAAGITGLIKLVLSLEHQQIPATLHCEKPHPRFKFDESPFYPNTSLRDWEPINGHRIGAISSFGFGGTNCHMIIEEGNQAHPIRRPLPLTQFKRKQYWLGREVVSQNARGSAVEHYRTLIEQLQQGEISRTTFKQLVKEVQG
ncbi:MAG: SDR family NAD(P)-dependent oxidoreductase [Anaerolineae bacterium]|nr:SDR family NAD(P)-dependent oxidoreductase [Anaerolineae bacterium]